MGGMRELDQRGQLNSLNVINLLPHPAALIPAVSANALVPSNLRVNVELGDFVPIVSAKSEISASAVRAGKTARTRRFEKKSREQSRLIRRALNFQQVYKSILHFLKDPTYLFDL